MTRRRCACRPGCLTWLRPDDVVVDAPGGLALPGHVRTVDSVIDFEPDVVDVVEASVAS